MASTMCSSGIEDRPLHLVCDPVHRVGAQQQELCARRVEVAGGESENLGRVVPSPSDLEVLDLGEVE